MAIGEVSCEDQVEVRMASGLSVAARRATAVAMAFACVAAVSLLAVQSPEKAQVDAASFSLGAPVHAHGWFSKVRTQASPSTAFMQATDSAMSAAKDADHFMLAAAPAAPGPPALEPSEAPAVMAGEEEAPAAEAGAEPAVAQPVHPQPSTPNTPPLHAEP